MDESSSHTSSDESSHKDVKQLKTSKWNEVIEEKEIKQLKKKVKYLTPNENFLGVWLESCDSMLRSGLLVNRLKEQVFDLYGIFKED